VTLLCGNKKFRSALCLTAKTTREVRELNEQTFRLKLTSLFT
jgi:hypothetical protein